MLDTGRIEQNNEIQMSITVDIGQQDRVWSAGNSEKSSGPQCAATGIQKDANIIKRWIGNDDVGFGVTIQVSDGNLMVLGITE
jgi:hypothetical protein